MVRQDRNEERFAREVLAMQLRYAALWPDELDAVAESIDDARHHSKISRTNRGPNIVALEPPRRAKGI
jgi:hypothetical protein